MFRFDWTHFSCSVVAVSTVLSMHKQRQLQQDTKAAQKTNTHADTNTGTITGRAILRGTGKIHRILFAIAERASERTRDKFLSKFFFLCYWLDLADAENGRSLCWL